MFVCGYNYYSQLDIKTTNENSNGSPIIDQPHEFHVNPSLFSCFSTNSNQTIWITHDGKSYVTGKNGGGIISGSLPKKTLPEDTEFFLKDEEGQPCKFVSVVCGFEYTLYLVSSESGVTNFKLVLCYENKTPNPLFVNIGDRTPLALFGGDEISGVIDTEGGIIVLTKSIFKSPRKQVEATFLPDGDKPVKLACCKTFVIALGMSGRIYESKTYSIKFEIVKELSKSTIIDVSGTFNFCFVVLKNGRVFGRGNNSDCQLGLPKETKSVKKFTLIKSLINHLIVSVFTGSSQSIFKTIDNKMIVCGSNFNGHLFIPLNDKYDVYPPEEVEKCKGFTFCVVGGGVSAAFFNLEAPPNFSNKKIDKFITKAKDKPKNENENENKEREESELIREIEDLKQKFTEKEYENQNLKKEILILKETNSRLKEENSELNKQIKNMKEDQLEQREQVNNGSLRILNSEEMKSYHKGKRIGRGSISEVYEATQEIKFAMKVLDIEMMKINKKEDDDNDDSEEEKNHEVDIEQAKKFPQESEVLNSLEDEHIIKTYGFFFGDEEEPLAIIFEYCESNLKKRIKKLTNEERISIIVDIISTMKKVHSKGIIHRDLKLENILLDTNNRAKLSDFGLCTFIKDDDETMSYTSMAGTMKYMSPELLQGHRDYDEKVDVYTFGVVLFLILTKGEYPDINFIDVGTGKQAPIPNSITKFSSQLIRDCWSFESKDRPSFSEICNRLKGNEHKLI